MHCIRHMHTIPEQKVKSILAQEIDPRKAVMTIDLEVIDTVNAIDPEKKWVELHLGSLTLLCFAVSSSLVCKTSLT